MPITASGPVSGGYWSSRSELETLFGATNISMWADLENTGNAPLIQTAINSALAVATDEAQSLLRGGACGEITSPSPALRKAVTQLAGVHLYEARGVKDASEDKSGYHKLTAHSRAAREFLLRVSAGQIRLSNQTVNLTNTPAVIYDAETETPTNFFNQ